MNQSALRGAIRIATPPCFLIETLRTVFELTCLRSMPTFVLVGTDVLSR